MSINRVPRRSGLFRSASFIVASAASLAGCAGLPSSGPTGFDIRHAAAPSKPGQDPFVLIEVENAAALPPAPSIPSSTLSTMPPRPTDLLGPGDVLNISIYEAGVSLFGTALRTAAAGGTTI